MASNTSEITCGVALGGLAYAATMGMSFLGVPKALGGIVTGAIAASFKDDCSAFLDSVAYNWDNSGSQSIYGDYTTPENSTLQLIGFSSRNFDPSKVGAISLIDQSQSALADWDMGDVSGSLLNTLGAMSVTGTKWAERIGATAFNDTVRGGAGNDVLNGGKGDDVIYGDGGNDFLRGARNADKLYDGAGVDTMRGGDGSDTFYFSDDGSKDTIQAANSFEDTINGFGDLATYHVANVGSTWFIADATSVKGNSIYFDWHEGHTKAELDTFAEVDAVLDHMLM